MQRIGQAGQDEPRIFHRADEFPQPRRGAGERIIEQRFVTARGAQPQPVVVQGHLVDGLAVLAEGMKIRVAELGPVPKFDAELEGRLRFAHDIVFVDAEQGVEGANRRNGGFADADGADLGRFDHA